MEINKDKYNDKFDTQEIQVVRELAEPVDEYGDGFGGETQEKPERP